MDQGTQKELIAMLPRLRRFAFGLSGNWDEADDLVQAACERAIARIDQWQPGTRLDSWVFRIIQTMRIDRARAGQTRQRHVEMVSMGETPVHDGERAMVARITLDAARRAIMALPQEQREVIMLICVEGLSYKETAETLGQPMGTVTSRLARGRAALERIMAEPVAGQPQEAMVTP